MCREWGTGKDDTRFWWRNPKEREHLQDFAIDGSIILKWILKRRGKRELD